MATPPVHVAFTLEMITKLLVRHGDMTPEQAKQALEQEHNIRTKLLKDRVRGLDSRRAARHDVGPSEVLASMEFISPNGRPLSEDVIMQRIAQAARLPFEKPDPLKLNMELITSTMQRAFARHNTCVPLRREDGKIVIAVNNPFDVQLMEQLKLLTQNNLKIVVSARADIQRIITEVYGFRSSVSAAEQIHSTGVDFGNLEQLTKLNNVETLEANDRPIVNAVEYLLHYAFNERASDIHIEPKRDKTLIRLRIDGVLHNIYSLPRAIHAAFVSRLKGMARMDIAEKRRPQDGRIKTSKDGREVELRVSSLPVAFGEKIVIRVFDPQMLIQELEGIGFPDDDLRHWRNFIARPHGLILVTGPTGSGKTTTLYSTLKELAGPDVNITTVEDPVEMVCEEFNQVLVQRRIDVTFATALRTILRQDPDIVMIGEIRDAETANMATQAALTGHLVFSTLHTNDTASSVTRMLDLGVEPFLLASTLVGVMAQRLLRTICPHCIEQTTLSSEQIDLLDLPTEVRRSSQSLPIYYGEGCIHCRGTGYYGRTGAFEILEVDTTVRKLISQNSSAPEIYKAARANNMRSLKESAIYQMAQKRTTFEEVMHVLSDYS